MKRQGQKTGKRKILLPLIAALVFCSAIISVSIYFLTKQKKEANQLDAIIKEKTEGKLRKITIAQFGHVFVYLPIYIAKDKGFFEQEGLDVTYVSTGGDEKTWAAVTSGSAQFGVADPTFVAIAREKGDKSGRIIASIIDGVPFWGVTRKKISIKKISDLSNLRVATYPAPSTNYALMNRLIKEHRLNTRIVQGAFGTLLAIMERGRADMAMELEPTTSLAVRQGYQVVFSYKNLYGDFALTGLSTTNSFINSHPDICQKVVQALQKAYKFAYHDLKGAIEVANKQFPDIDKDAVQMGVKRMIEDKIIPRSVVVKEKSWNEAISLRRHIGDLKSNAPFSENVDNQFSEIAVQSVSE